MNGKISKSQKIREVKYLLSKKQVKYITSFMTDTYNQRVGELMSRLRERTDKHAKVIYNILAENLE